MPVASPPTLSPPILETWSNTHSVLKEGLAKRTQGKGKLSVLIPFASSQPWSNDGLRRFAMEKLTASLLISIFIIVYDVMCSKFKFELKLKVSVF